MHGITFIRYSFIQFLCTTYVYWESLIGSGAFFFTWLISQRTQSKPPLFTLFPDNSTNAKSPLSFTYLSKIVSSNDNLGFFTTCQKRWGLQVFIYRHLVTDVRIYFFLDFFTYRGTQGKRAPISYTRILYQDSPFIDSMSTTHLTYQRESKYSWNLHVRMFRNYQQKNLNLSLRTQIFHV